MTRGAALLAITLAAGLACAAAPRASVVALSVAAPSGGVKALWVYLPPGYELSGARYPVAYMLDGQDLFYPRPYFAPNPYIDDKLQRRLRRHLDAHHSWQLNARLDRLIGARRLRPLIVVGIASDDGRRTADYSPWEWADEPDPAGAAFARFVATIVKPLIDDTFRTLAGREHSAVVGSSMGGLIALYTVFEHPQVFARAAALSPVLSPRVTGGRLSARVPAAADAGPLRVYADLGEFETGFGPLAPLGAALAAAGHGDYRLQTIAGGRHRVIDWRARIGDVLRWLYR